MVFQYGRREALLAFAIFLILILIIVYKWSPVELIVSSVAIVLSFFAGSTKREKWMK